MPDAPNGANSNMVQEKKKVAANIAMAFMQHQQQTQSLASQMVEMMKALVQQNQAIMQMLQMPKQSRIIRDPQTGDVVGSEQVPMQTPQEQMGAQGPTEAYAPEPGANGPPGPMMPPQGAGM